MGELAEDALGDEVHVARGEAGVVARVRGLRLGDVKVSRGLGDETSPVGRDEIGEFVQEPPVGQAWVGGKRKKLDRFVLPGGMGTVGFWVRIGLSM